MGGCVGICYARRGYVDQRGPAYAVLAWLLVLRRVCSNSTHETSLSRLPMSGVHQQPYQLDAPEIWLQHPVQLRQAVAFEGAVVPFPFQVYDVHFCVLRSTSCA